MFGLSANVFNSLLYFASILFYMGGTVFMYKKFGKTGIFIWSAISVIMANVEALKMVDMFGFNSGLGNAVYASSFLATDILSEMYGKKDGIKAVNIGLVTTIIWVIFSQQVMWFIPNSFDYINPAFQQVFTLSPVFALGGIFTYAVTQRADVYLYEGWRKVCNKIWSDPRKGLWIRNNGSTLISQLLDTVILMVIVACFGIYPWEALPEMIFITYVLKATANLLDTPFLYLARKLKESGKVKEC